MLTCCFLCTIKRSGQKRRLIYGDFVTVTILKVENVRRTIGSDIRGWINIEFIQIRHIPHGNAFFIDNTQQFIIFFYPCTTHLSSKFEYVNYIGNVAYWFNMKTKRC